MKLKQCVLGCLSLMLAACTGDYDQPPILEDEPQGTRSIESKVSLTQDSILTFSNAEVFNEVLGKLQSLQTEEQRLEYMQTLAPNFVSMRVRYIKALEEVDSLVNTEEDFLALKQRYPEFYYANEGEDGGIYMPIEEPLYAYVVSPLGKVQIGLQRETKRKIPDYEKLKEEGLTYSDLDKTIELEVMPDTLMGELQNNKEQYKTFTFHGNYLKEIPKGVKYSSGWIKNGKRKFKLMAKREARRISYPGGAYIWDGRLHLELCFRKKVGLSWINYYSRTETKLKVKHENDINWQTLHQQNRNGFSSHDLYYGIPCFTSRLPNGFIRHTYPTLECDATIKYNGFSNSMNFKWSLLGAYYDAPREVSVIKAWH